ncbi:hypothetical protein [Bacillus mobilis]|uniref:hypothetical protein n=1 Tax=Bacillus mobilis TaxID=2026190 RepID=UPI00367FB253
MLSLLGTAAAIHIAPNLAMKAVKSTKTGQKALAATFGAGVDMGRKGQKLQHTVKDFMEYGIGPESLVEYEMGQSVGHRLQGLPEHVQTEALKIFREQVKEQFSSLTDIQKQELDKTPYVNTLIHYAEGKDDGKLKDALMKLSIPESEEKKLRHHVTNMGILGGVGMVEPHALMQPAISAARKYTAQSAYGKKFMKNSFKKGLQGKMTPKLGQVATDMLISPAALDAMRVGSTLSKARLNASPQLKSSVPYQLIDKVCNEISGL